MDREQPQKPPLGVIPRRLFEEKRMKELLEASLRRVTDARPIPNEWIDELVEHNKRKQRDEKLFKPHHDEQPS